MKSKIILIILLSFSFFLRVIDINNNPPALYGDELTLVYDAYSLLKTGHDQTGSFLPLTFTMSEGRPPGYVYFSIPFVALFGPNAFAVRILSVLSGVGIVFLIYLLTKELLSKKTAFIAAFLVSISPWDLSLSRGGFETHFALFLTLLAAVALLKARTKPWLFIVAALGFGVSIYTYHSYKVVAPLFLLLIIWFGNYLKIILKKEYFKYFLISALIFLFFIAVWLIQITEGSEVRFKGTSIFYQPKLNEEIVQRINSERALGAYPQQINQIFHNKFIEYSFILGGNYLNHFSLDFLFLHGDGNPRHNPGLMGELYLGQLFLVILGFTSLFWFKRKLLFFLVSWVLIAPIATAIVSGPHALRSSFLLPPLIILSAEGAIFLLSLAKTNIYIKVFSVVICLAIVIQFLFLGERLYFLSPNQFNNFWSYQAKQVSIEASESEQNYNQIILSDRIDNIEFAYPVYASIDPNIVINQNKGRVNLGKFQFKKFGNVYIGSLPNGEIEGFVNSLTGSVLYLGPAEDEKVLKNYNMVYDKFGKPVYLKVIKNN